MPEQESIEPGPEEKFNPQLQEGIQYRREQSERMLIRHGAERSESGELVLTAEQIARIKKEGERFPDQQMYELYHLASETLNILTKLQPSAPLTADEELALIGANKKERAKIEAQAAEREKERFINGEIENPRFTYPLLERSKLDLDSISTNLRNIKKIIKNSAGDHGLRALYQEKLNGKIAEVEMLRAVKEGDDKKFYHYSKFVYGEPDESICQVAEQEIDSYNPRERAESVFPTEIVKRALEEALRVYGWENIEVKTSARKTQVTTGAKSITIPEGREETEIGIRELIVHEIETHILRRESGKRAPLRIIRAGSLGRYLSTEEGLSVQAEERVNREVGVESKWPEFAVRLVGLHLAKTHNFRETYTELQKIYQRILEKEQDPEGERKSKDMAYNLAVRIFRGIHHPEEAGHFYTKDWVYYKGSIDVAHFISQGGDINQLYIGKIGLHHISILTELGIIKPAITPRFVASKIEVLPS